MINPYVKPLHIRLANGEISLERINESMNEKTTFDFTGYATSWPPYFLEGLPGIRKVIFNQPATIIYWGDNTKTVVKCGENDEWDKEKGLVMAIAKKAMGNKGNYNNVLKRWLNDD